ncbi:MAG: MATE family efflux transporter [Candidatus Aenigmarchaeota archaeon]|nr:MATE family efflux transporter [Candidatus Aenigmarchaeota archaeon]
MNGNKGRDLTQGPIGKSLLVLSAPIVLGMALQTAFNIIDTFFVGMLGSEQLAAISVTFPVVFIFIAIAVGLAVGTTALVSQALGARKDEEATNIAEHSLLAALVVGFVVAALGITFSPPLFEFMGVHGEVLEMTVSYANLIFIGFMFLFIGFLSQGIIQAGGDTVTPTKNLAVSVAANIILDPIMIFGFGPVPAMGLIGAGYATVIGRSVGAFLNLLYLLRGRALVKIKPKAFRFRADILKRIFLIGWPSSFSQSINSVGMILLMSMVGAFGTGALAAFGVGIRLESLAIMPVMGMGNALVPMIGQNLGAGNIKRAKSTLRMASYAVGLFMLLIMALWYFAPDVLYAPFSTDAGVLSIGEDYLRIISFGYLFLGLVFITGSAFQAAGRTTLQMLINMFRWSAIVAGAWLFSSAQGITGIWWGFPLGNFLGFIVFAVFLKSGFWLRKWER